MKKFKQTLSALMAASIFASAFAVTSAQAISRPDNLSISDITYLQKGIAGLVPLDKETIKTYDVNGDGEITISEVTYWQKVLVGLEDPEVMPACVSLNLRKVTLGVGETVKLSASSNLSDFWVAYSSSNNSVATVAANGTVTAKATGTATITVTTENGLRETCTVTVNKMATSVSLNKSSMTLGIGESYNLAVTIPSDTVAYKKTATTSNSSVATATISDNTCKVTAKGEGTATITVKLLNGKQATCKVTVKKMATSVTLNKTSLTLGVGETFDLNSSIPSGTAAYYRDFYSKNTAVATATKSGGIVTAVAPGTTTVYVQLKNGAVANCTITVKKMATVVLLNKTSLSLDVGKTYTLTASIPSSTAAYYKTFTSSDTSVATVNSSGVVTGKGAGRATITVKLNNGKSASCTVVVNPDVETAERQLETLINEYRASKGLKALSTTTALRNAAGKRATEASTYFSHTRPNGTSFSTVLNEYGIKYTLAGECLAGYSSDPVATLTQWKNSSGHNDILLNKNVTHMSIGCEEKDGYYYWIYITIQQG